MRRAGPTVLLILQLPALCQLMRPLARSPLSLPCALRSSAGALLDPLLGILTLQHAQPLSLALCIKSDGLMHRTGSHPFPILSRAARSALRVSLCRSSAVSLTISLAYLPCSTHSWLYFMLCHGLRAQKLASLLVQGTFLALCYLHSTNAGPAHYTITISHAGEVFQHG